MCGRITLRRTFQELEQAFDAMLAGDLRPRYNIAPTQDILTIREAEVTGAREAVVIHWGLIPPWAPDEKIGGRMINARAETIQEKRSFSSPLKKRRCLILADGFYEWREENGAKQPYFIHRKDDQPFAFAGLWEVWKKGPEPVESCTIITTAANEFMEKLHHRMPVILQAKDYGKWLNSTKQEPEELVPLLEPRDWKGMESFAVTKSMNKASYQSPDSIEPV